MRNKTIPKSKETIYKEILKEMPQNLSEEEKAAFIMKKIAEERSFSSRYYWSSNKVREKMYRLAKRDKLSIRKNKRQLICVTATKLFKDIATRFGLDVYIIGDSKMTKDDLDIFESGEHVSPVIKTKDGRFIKADTEWNLENIQTGRRWMKFGTKDEGQDNLDTLSQEKIDEIMKKIGYIKNENEYLENYLRKLNLKNSDITTEDKLKILFSDQEISKRVAKLKSSVDIYRFYRRIIKEEIGNEVTLFGAYSKNKLLSRKKYSILAHLQAENTDDKFWIWSNKQKKMTNISKTHLKHFINNSMLSVVKGKRKEKYDNLMESIQKDINKNNTSEVEVPLNEIWTR